MSTLRISKAREKILQTALELFYRKGINRVGVDEVVEQSGVAKMTLYKHFPSKNDLINEVVLKGGELWLQWFKSTVERLASDPDERLIAVFDAIHLWFEAPHFRGCGAINIVTELAEPTHSAHLSSRTRKSDVYNYIRQLADQASLQQPDDLARQFMLLIDGATVNELLYRNQLSAKDAKAIASLLLDNYKKRS